MDNDTENLYRRLSEPFPKEMERVLSKGGTSLTYIPISEVINRMNKILGIGNWSSEVIYVHRDALDNDFITAHVRLTAKIGDQTIIRDGVGGQTIKRTKSGSIVDLGDEFKGAVSDAFKKACQTLGVGLYLARKEEAMDAEIEAEMPAIDPEIQKLWENFLSITKSLSADEKTLLNEFWAEWADGKPKPRLETATAEDLEALIAEATRLHLGGGFDND